MTLKGHPEIPKNYIPTPDVLLSHVHGHLEKTFLGNCRAGDRDNKMGRPLE